MAQQSLAVKYRPRTFDDVSEQSAIKVILQRQLETGEIKNAYLFCGGAGTGKTTCARIFADEINHHKGNPIELDAASNNSVDDVREIIQQAKTQSLDSEYKVFIIDECFHGSTLITTPSGAIPIKDIIVGDLVCNMGGVGTVTNVFENSVLTNRLCCVTIDNVKTYTTVDHLYFTNNGWVEAQNLEKGDIVYAPTYLRNLWKGILKQTKDSEILLHRMLCCLTDIGESKEISRKYGCSILRGLWEAIQDDTVQTKEDLLKRVQKSVDFLSGKTDNAVYRVWTDVKKAIKSAYVTTEPDARRNEYTEDDRDEEIEWYLERLERSEGWQWAVYNATTKTVRCTESGADFRICNPNTPSENGAPVSYLLQSRPRLSNNKTCDRGGWEESSIEAIYRKGFEENSISKFNRVESVEIYKRGYNDESFRGGFSDTVLCGDYVTMYDIEVDNHPSYFANGTLVHNCHMLSTSAWNALLKILEEPPKHSIFIMATTDPQKIPKTILSRVQRYDFQRISRDGIANRLSHILESEFRDAIEWTWEADAVDYLSKLSEGGMRDAITMLDKCLAYSTDLTIENVVKALGTVEYDTMIKLTSAIVGNDVNSAVDVVESVYHTGKDIKHFVESYLEFLLDVCKYETLLDFQYVTIPSTYEKELQNLIKDNLTIRDLLVTILHLNTDIKWATNPKMLFEASIMTFIFAK